MLKSASFQAMGTVNAIAVDDAAMLVQALALAENVVRRIDATCSRFKADSELSLINRRAGRGEVHVSDLMEEALLASLATAEMTGGRVDPTVGKIVEDLGYTVTFGEVPLEGPAIEVHARGVAGWQAVSLDTRAHTVALPDGVALDLGASAKAWAADRAAEAVAAALGVGVLVECGGDVAVRGKPPAGGWPVRVAEDTGASAWQDVAVHDGGLATSGTTSRRWRRGGVVIHDIIDPSTWKPADTPWRMVTVAAATCLEANAAATAALVMGDEALSWLDDLRLPARLVRADGGVQYAGGWAG